VVRHELVAHTSPNVAFTKLGNAVATSAISSSVEQKAHPPLLEQDDSSIRGTSP
jgi:hypothetical protein